MKLKQIPWNKGLKKGDHPSIDKIGFKKGNQWAFEDGHDVPDEWIKRRKEETDKNISIKPLSARRRALNRFKNIDTCEECKSKGTIHRHHIDENLYNNERSNLKFLCPSCHNKIHKNWLRLKRDNIGRLFAMISIDDFHKSNMRLAEMIKKHSLEKDTWFAIEIDGREKVEQIEELSLMGFNIAAHTESHAHLSRIPINDAIHEMAFPKQFLEDITGQEIEWLVYPRGRYNKEVIEAAKEIGYKYGRTTKLLDLSDMERGGCHLSFQRTEYKGIDPFDWAKQSTMNHYWFHAFEVERYGLIDKIEEFLVWYKKTYYLSIQAN